MKKFRFSKKEISDLLVSALILSFVVAYPFRGMETASGIAKQMGVLVIVLGAAFIFHEIAHKFAAQNYGCWSEFRMWKEGLFLAMLFKFLVPNTPFILIAPGATYFSPFIGGLRHLSLTLEQQAKISLAGPMTNVAMAILFFSVAPFFGEIAYLAVSVNLMLAFFNLLPLGPLDGTKVARWNFGIWMMSILSVIFLQGFLIPI